MWDKYLEDLSKLSYQELLDSHIREGKMRWNLEQTLTKLGFQLNEHGEYENSKDDARLAAVAALSQVAIRLCDLLDKK
jgi:hypothetical protein